MKCIFCSASSDARIIVVIFGWCSRSIVVQEKVKIQYEKKKNWRDSFEISWNIFTVHIYIYSNELHQIQSKSINNQKIRFTITRVSLLLSIRAENLSSRRLDLLGSSCFSSDLSPSQYLFRVMMISCYCALYDECHWKEDPSYLETTSICIWKTL